MLQIVFSVYLCLSQWVCISVCVCVCEQFYVVLILQLAFCNLRHKDQMDAPSPLSVVGGGGLCWCRWEMYVSRRQGCQVADK